MTENHKNLMDQGTKAEEQTPKVLQTNTNKAQFFPHETDV